jgi:hypothetical protein
MARWTKSREEEKHLAKVNLELSQTMAKGFLMQAVMKGGRTVEGLVTASKFGNNPKTETRPVEYYCEFTLRLQDKTLMVIDALDVESLTNVTTKERLAQFTGAK